MALSTSAYAVTAGDLLPTPTPTPTETNEDGTTKVNKELEAYKDLPDLGINEAISKTIKIILAMTMSLTIVALVIAGIFYMISEGDEEDVGKAKSIIVYLVIGMAIMAAAYGVTSGISKVDFFNTPPEATTSE